MLSEKRKMTRPEYLRSLPEPEKPIAIRLRFVKMGKLQYISHLDLQRTFNRILVRSGLPVWYSKGFNPHVKLVFSTPLSVGTQSVCEFLDLRLDRELPLEDIKDLLNNEMTDEMYITEVYYPESKFSDIAFCEYDYQIFTEGASPDMAKKISGRLGRSPLLITKKTKSGEKEIDIVPLIKCYDVSYDESERLIRIKAILSAGTDNFLNPEMLISALKTEIQILQGDPSKEWYSILRTRALTSEFCEFR